MPAIWTLKKGKSGVKAEDWVIGLPVKPDNQKGTNANHSSR